MTYHFTIFDEIVSDHINKQMGDLDFLGECYNVRYNVKIDNHGNQIDTFSKALAFMVDSGFFLCYYDDIIDFLTGIDVIYHLPYNRSVRPISDWSGDQLWSFYRKMIIRSGIKYLDLCRQIRAINYNGFMI